MKQQSKKHSGVLGKMDKSTLGVKKNNMKKKSIRRLKSKTSFLNVPDQTSVL